MLSSIAEFENDLRAERQREGIEKALENGVRFGRPSKRTPEIDAEIIATRLNGSTIGSISKQFKLGEATIYRILKKHNNQGSVANSLPR